MDLSGVFDFYRLLWDTFSVGSVFFEGASWVLRVRFFRGR